MAKLGITKKKLLSEYKHAINEIADAIDTKTTFNDDEVCQIVYGILIKHDVKTTLSENKLYKLYKADIKALKITDKEWREKYGVPEIINIIYNILKKNI